GGFTERTHEPLATAQVRQEALEMGFLPIPYHPAARPNFRGTAPVALARQWLTASGLDAEGLAFLPVLTDDMVPTLTVGALALLDTTRQTPEDDAIWALGLRGGYVFARVQRPSADMFVLKGDKPNQPVQILKGDELRALKVLGKVVWIAQQP
ncbi:MAG: S24 family peptidase, partial [Octadecabacter sp.]